ncbi:MAG: hypothetical protein ABJN42_20360, partial [Roseibium sp.]|uniref:hypothetical protein n=1 Tax=Roseibium sp. TaxID=1936156 RepID=UPI0032993BDD
MSTDKKKSALPKGKISSADAKGNIRAEMAIDPALEARRPELTSPEAIGDVKKKLQDFQTSVTRLENMPGMFDDIPIGAPAAAAPAAAVAATPTVADDIPEVISGGDDQNKSEEPAEEEIVFPDTSAESVDGIATGLGDDEADDASDEVDAFADLNIPAAEETVAEEAPTPTEEKTSGDFNFDDAEDLQDEPDPFAGIADTDDVPDVKAPEAHEASEMPEAASEDGDQGDDVFGDMTFNRVDEDDLTADLDDEDVAGDTFLGDLDDVDEDNRTHSETAPEWEAELAAAEAEVEADQEADPEAAIEPDQDELPDAEDGDYDDGEIGDILSEMTQTDEDASSEERIEAPDEGDFVWDQPEAVSEEAAEQDYSDFSNVPEMSEDADFVPEDVDAELFNEIDIATLSAPAVTDDVDDFAKSEELTQDDEPQVAVADDFESDLTNDVTEGSEDDWFNEMISEDAEEVTPEEPAVMPEADVAAATEEPEA